MMNNTHKLPLDSDQINSTRKSCSLSCFFYACVRFIDQCINRQIMYHLNDGKFGRKQDQEKIKIQFINIRGTDFSL